MTERFINEFFELGFASYKGIDNNNNFERHVVESLYIIFDRELLDNIYNTKDEIQFEKLFDSFDITNRLYDNFIRNTNELEDYRKLRLTNPTMKSDVCFKIEENLMEFFKNKLIYDENHGKVLDESKINEFERNLKEKSAVEFYYESGSDNYNRIIKRWEYIKNEIMTVPELIKVEYLDENMYKKYGYSIADIKKMDYRMIENINNNIRKKEIESENVKTDNTLKQKNKLSSTVISSGNGYVDALLIACIIATEMSIGFIYLFLHM